MVLAEGHSEQTFCEELLWPALGGYEDKRVTRLDPSGSQQGRRARGGHAHRFAIIERDLRRVLNGGFDVVTTMIDLYHLPEDFPGLDDAKKIPDPIARARKLEAALHTRMGAPRAVPGRVYGERSRSSLREAGRWLENHRWRFATVGEGHEHSGHD
jgi:hypothetical protein